MIGVEIKELQTINLVVYRPPDTKRAEFKVIIDALKSILNEMDNQKYTIILSGDFNFRFVEWNRNQSGACSHRYKQGTSKEEKDQFLDLMEVCDDQCLVQIIEEPTRGENTLDLIFTNEVSLINDIEVNKSNKSDHCRVEISTNFIIKEENMKKPHNNKDIDIKDVNFHEPNINWNKVKDITKVKIKETWRDENDPIMETEEFVKLIQEISLEYLPRKKRGNEKGIP